MGTVCVDVWVYIATGTATASIDIEVWAVAAPAAKPERSKPTAEPLKCLSQGPQKNVQSLLRSSFRKRSSVPLLCVPGATKVLLESF